MKVLLLVLIGFTVSPAFAADGIWFKGDSQSCQTGSELKVNSAKDIKVLVSTDLSKIERQLVISSGTISETFKLVKVGGKDKYMAVPEQLDHTDVFYVQITEDMQVTLNYSDFAGTVCGGGLVVTNLVKDPASPNEFVEESSSSVAGN